MNTSLIHCAATNETLLVVGGSFNQDSQVNAQNTSNYTQILLAQDTTECREFARNLMPSVGKNFLLARTEKHARLIIQKFECGGSEAALNITEHPPLAVLAEDGATVDQFETGDYEFLWHPYIPLTDYTILMAPGGVGKSFFAAGLIAAITSGAPLPGQDTDDFQPTEKVVLVITAEEDASQIVSRVKSSGGKLGNLVIIDRKNSSSISFENEERIHELRSLVRKLNAALVIIDPWHAFIGASVDINRINRIRPVLQNISTFAKDCNCAILMISHTNKKKQEGNINNAAQGSADLINAARSALMVIFDQEDGHENCRIVIHTKSNYAAHGVAQRFRITGHGREARIEWVGESQITKAILEEAEQKRKSPFEILKLQKDPKPASFTTLLGYFKAALAATATGYKNIAYKAVQDDLGYSIFGSKQPKAYLNGIRSLLNENGIDVTDIGKHVRYNGKGEAGFTLQRIDPPSTGLPFPEDQEEQLEINEQSTDDTGD